MYKVSREVYGLKLQLKGKLAKADFDSLILGVKTVLVKIDKPFDLLVDLRGLKLDYFV